MKNYRNRPDLTSAAVTPDGWYKTGDYGYYDDQERFHIKDRVKDLILLPDGKTLVSPSTIENLVLQHEAVFQVGVSGIPSTSGTGNVPRAFVILKQHVQDLVPDDIVKFVEG
ncbi:unnamed protein product [Notodromas monacha]|nr:unnamed protein product [Notodromas monacha]CAG0926008.1 unnamed protein product [Notodromas monacha]